MNNRGSVYGGVLMFYSIMFIFFILFGVTAFQSIFISEMHNIKNDLYLINRNVLLALQRDIMGEDVYAFYEQDVKNMVEEEIKRQWDVDVSCITEKGPIEQVDVLSAKIINEKNKMYIESILNVKMRPVLFQEALKDVLSFKTKEIVKVEKMKGWGDEE